MALKKSVDSLADVPEPFRGEYEARDGKFFLKVEGGDDVEGLKSALAKEREQRAAAEKAAAAAAAKYGDLDPEKARAAQARLQELEDKRLKDEGKHEEAFNARTERMRADHAAQAEALLKAQKELKAENEALNGRLSSVLIDNGIVTAAAKAGVRKSAIPDVVRRGREIFVLKDGKPLPERDGRPVYGKDGKEPMSIEEWVTGLSSEAGHLFEGSAGGGATGSGNGAARPHTITAEQAKDFRVFNSMKQQAEKAGHKLEMVP